PEPERAWPTQEHKPRGGCVAYDTLAGRIDFDTDMITLVTGWVTLKGWKLQCGSEPRDVSDAFSFSFVFFSSGGTFEKSNSGGSGFWLRNGCVSPSSCCQSLSLLVKRSICLAWSESPARSLISCGSFCKSKSCVLLM